ncbi:hypothetical protein GCM10023340_25610 [Nocardioides marinquilinus]|uniref:Peptidase MA-like domain-containing protein n=1 Tax=Nocardioides marinquilinus TaxID=1210400 RepID=A0ABP9PTZ3_9ACTN
MALALALLVPAACSGADEAPTDGSQGADATPYAEPSLPPPATPSSEPTPGKRHPGPRPPDVPTVTADLATVLTGVLRRRADAVVTGDRGAFLDVLTADPGLREREGGYFDNLVQLPLATFDYELLPESLVRADRGYWAVVEVTMQLDGFDDLPVTTLDRYRLVPAGRGWRLASTTDPRWERSNATARQPWDLEPVVVRRQGSVLGVFDRGTLARAPELMDAVTSGLSDVAARVPYDWSRSAVFYALSDPRFLDGFENLPGGDPDALDGVAFTVPAGPGDATAAATRFVLSPALMSGPRRSPDVLGRLVRHELAHLAIGGNDDVAPVWLVEGLAEWVSVQALPVERRRVPDSVVREVRDGVREMPDEASFNDGQAQMHYALAWWVCEWLALTYGDDVPWAFLDAFASLSGGRGDDGGGGGGRAEEDRVVEQVLGLSTDELARRGAALLLETYDREPAPSEGPSGSPSPSGTPSDGGPSRGADAPSPTPGG